MSQPFESLSLTPDRARAKDHAMTYIAASDYIYRVVPGARPTHDEVIDTVYWCREWVRDTFADTDVDELGDLVVLRGCESHIDGGLAFVLADVRRVNALGEGC